MKRLGMLFALVLAFNFGAAQATYKVKPGDTIEEIARRFNCKTSALAKKNGIKDVSKIKVGQVLRLPTDPSSYVNGKIPASIKQTSVVRVADSQRVATTIKSNVNVREKPSLTARVVTQVDKGRAAKVLRTEGNWVKLQFPGGTIGFVRKDMVQIASHSAPSQSRTVQASHQSSKTNTSSAKIATITKPNVNVREKPISTSRVIARVDKGRTAKVLRTEGEWVKLQFPGGTIGFVHKDLLTVSASAGQAAKHVTQKPAAVPVSASATAGSVTITADDVNLRAGPSTRQPVVAKLKKGAQAKLISRRGDWLKVEFVGGAKGFVHASVTSLTKSEAATPANPYTNVVAEAKRYLGVRYIYGGETTRGFDCSGFVWYVYKNVAGIELPRVSTAQANVGVKVDKNDLQPGDLVFFRTGRSSRINHAGIYIGNGQFIHASSGGGQVEIDSLAEGYYSKRFVTARRIVKK